MLSLLAVTLLSSAAPAPAVRVNDSAIVRVECTQSVGTAFRVSANKYVTAAHVVRGTKCRIDGKSVENVKMYPDDLATFTSEATAPGVVKLDCSGFVPEKHYLAVGHAFGNYFLTYEPLIAAPFVQANQQTFVGEVIPGMSGGPVLNIRGEVVGIVSRRWPARSTQLKDTEVCG